MNGTTVEMSWLDLYYHMTHFGSHLNGNDVAVESEKEVQNFKKAGFKFIYFVDFIRVLIMFLLAYHLNDISDVALPKIFRPCINSLKTGMSAGLWFLPEMQNCLGMAFSSSSHLSKAATLGCQINVPPTIPPHLLIFHFFPTPRPY